MARLGRLGPVILSVVLVVATGGLGLTLTAHANTKAEQVLVKDRVTLQTTLAGLGKQYLLFSLKEGLDYASSGSWQLTPDSAADRSRLESFVDHATFLNYGAALVTVNEQVLDAYSTGPPLPPPDDPGYGPMINALVAAKPDVSSVMDAGSVPVVAMGAPIEVAGQVKAILVGFMPLRRSALESYVERLDFGRTSQAFVVDSAGTVVAAHDPSLVGTHLAQPQALAGATEGSSGSYRDTRQGTEVTYASFGVGGWFSVTVQSAAVFFGPIRSSDLRIGLALIGLLALASALIIVLGYRQAAARRRYHELLAHQAYHDGLTGLANRSLLHDRLNQAVSRARRQGRGVSLLYLDLDGFKPVNDREGHEVGDELLVAVAERLAGSVRAEDTVARIGGDEFAVIMEDVDDPASIRQAAERLVGEFRRPFAVRGHDVVVGASVGIAFSPHGEDDGESMLRDADLAMYRAKDAGKCGYVFSNEPVTVTVLLT